MTIPYDATGRNCIECGAVVEDYTGHSGASEMTACERCHETVKENSPWSVDVVHCVPRKDNND